ncbi:DoxX family protein [Pedobacter yulinensis]|uniref:DoxX family protein n=1 Tax=Pedobacter yulinensis TaxID=2126353 RepID=A0A2T3HRG4_9SPHI|nr:DoxX family protein [Pedobacter yulinensis]PST84993.1 DoxX family protein [Pedobacter yulinensis]
MAIFDSLGKYRNTGLLLLRAGIGIMFMVHGLPKLMGGPEMWAQVGGAMKVVGIDFAPTFWGLLAAIAEGIGGFLLLIGLFFRPAAIALAFTMIIAAAMHLSNGDGMNGASHAIESAIVFIGLIFIGPGKYSVDKK